MSSSLLERLPNSRFSRVNPAWRGLVVAILAGGTSLSAEQFEAVRVARSGDLVRVIAINDSYLRAPWADVSFAADAKWHRWHNEGIAKPVLGLSAEQVREAWENFAGERCSVQQSNDVPDRVHVVRTRNYPDESWGLSMDPHELVTGRHGGFQALNLAILGGVRGVILLGYDYRVGDNGSKHWHGEHPPAQDATLPTAYQEFKRAFSRAENDIAAAGVKVINCSPGTTLDTFPKMSLEEALVALLAS